MMYMGMFELQPLFDGHKSFYGKAVVERWNNENGKCYFLKSYGTVVATDILLSAPDAENEVHELRVDLRHLSATTLRHVKEFMAQIDGAFEGVSLKWLREAIRDGRRIDGETTELSCRKSYVLGSI